MTRARPETSIFLEVFALDQAIGQLLREAMAGGPLTPEEYAVYSAIFAAEAITPTQVAQRLGMPKTTVMERVREMEERGHVRRIAHPDDGRSYRLVLTASGLLAHRRSHDLFDAAYQAFLREHRGSELMAESRLAQLRTAVEAAAKRKAGPPGRPRR